MISKREDLKLILISGAGAAPEDTDIYNECYRVWRQVWKSTFQELGKDQNLYSDGFTRQHQIVALFNGEECIALSTLRRTHFDFATMREDSLLGAWNEEAYQKLIRDGHDIMICSYLSVAPEYRRKLSNGLETWDLLARMISKCFLESGCDAMTGTMRLERRSEQVGLSIGGSLLSVSEMYGYPVQLFGFFRPELIEAEEKRVNLISEDLWRRRRLVAPSIITVPKRNSNAS